MTRKTLGLKELTIALFFSVSAFSLVSVAESWSVSDLWVLRSRERLKLACVSASSLRSCYHIHIWQPFLSTGHRQWFRVLNCLSLPGFLEPTYSLLHPIIKLNPEVMNHLSSHFGTVQTDIRWCRRFDRHCRLFTWNICISWNHSQICQYQSVLFCGCILLFRTCFTQLHQPYDKIPRVYLKFTEFSPSFPESTNCLRFQGSSRFSRAVSTLLYKLATSWVFPAAINRRIAAAAVTTL